MSWQRSMFPEVRPMRRWLYAVVMRVVAWCLRPAGSPRIPVEELDVAVRKAWPRFPWEWRAQLYEDAQALNRRNTAGV